MEKQKKLTINLSKKELIEIDGGGPVGDAGEWVGCKIKTFWRWLTEPGEETNMTRINQMK